MKFSECANNSERRVWIERVLNRLWNDETSANPVRWRSENPSTNHGIHDRRNPAWGQGAVSALIVQDLLGGELHHVDATMPDGEVISHDYNRIPCCKDKQDCLGQDVDMTKIQFPDGTTYSESVPRIREHVLSDPLTVWRYAKLLSGVARELIAEEGINFAKVFGLNPGATPHK